VQVLLFLLGIGYLTYWFKVIKNKPKENRSFVDEPYLPGGIMFTIIGLVFLIEGLITWFA